MNKSHHRTLKAIFAQPIAGTLEWRRIEALFVALGAQIIEGSGSRVRFVLNVIVATFIARIRKKRQSLTRCAMHEDFWRTQE